MVENRTWGLALKNTRVKRYVQNHWVSPIASEHVADGMPYQGCVEV